MLVLLVNKVRDTIRVQTLNTEGVPKDVYCTKDVYVNCKIDIGKITPSFITIYNGRVGLDSYCEFVKLPINQTIIVYRND